MASVSNLNNISTFWSKTGPHVRGMLNESRILLNIEVILHWILVRLLKLLPVGFGWML